MRLFVLIFLCLVTLVAAQVHGQYPGPGQYNPGQGFMPPGQMPGQMPGAAPRGMVFCAPGEFYNPSFQMCCNYEVVQMTAPHEFAQCCDGEVMDNRTELCCANQDRVSKFEQGCCGIEGYDLYGEGCCGNRYIYDTSWQTCCGSTVIPRFGYLCCDGSSQAIPMGQSPANFMCCGRRMIDRTTHTCCGSKSIRKGSRSTKCCDGEPYSPGRESCCTDANGEKTVTRGATCAKETTPPPTVPATQPASQQLQRPPRGPAPHLTVRPPTNAPATGAHAQGPTARGAGDVPVPGNALPFGPGLRFPGPQPSIPRRFWPRPGIIYSFKR